MRHTEFWARLHAALGESYAPVWSSQQVMSSLGGRTVDQALADGLSPKQVWRAVVERLELPESER